MTWRDHAECRQYDPELWFPDRGGNAAAAIRICQDQCPVIVACAREAARIRLEGPLWGIWGGQYMQRLTRTQAQTILQGAPSS